MRQGEAWPPGPPGSEEYPARAADPRVDEGIDKGARAENSGSSRRAPGLPNRATSSRGVLMEVDGVLAADADMVEDDFPAEAAEGRLAPQAPRGLIEGWGSS